MVVNKIKRMKPYLLVLGMILIVGLQASELISDELRKLSKTTSTSNADWQTWSADNSGEYWCRYKNDYSYGWCCTDSESDADCYTYNTIVCQSDDAYEFPSDSKKVLCIEDTTGCGDMVHYLTYEGEIADMTTLDMDTSPIWVYKIENLYGDFNGMRFSMSDISGGSISVQAAKSDTDYNIYGTTDMYHGVDYEVKISQDEILFIYATASDSYSYIGGDYVFIYVEAINIDDGLTGGEIAGIVIGASFGAIGITAILFLSTKYLVLKEGNYAKIADSQTNKRNKLDNTNSAQYHEHGHGINDEKEENKEFNSNKAPNFDSMNKSNISSNRLESTLAIHNQTETTMLPPINHNM